MSVGIQVVIKDTGTPAVQRVRAAFSRPEVRRVIGQSASEVVRGHLYRLDRERPNRLGGERTHFYGEAADKTHWDLTGDGVRVSISHRGIAQRYFGGTIRPVVRKYLAIPAHADAHGKRPIDSEFTGLLRVVFGRGRKPIALARVDRVVVGGSGRPSRGDILYWLKTSVRQDADPTVLPPDRDILRPSIAAAARYLRREASAGSRSG